jgi:tripartite-type tricarboxylate transporter receptor subunit TctC
MIQHRRVAAWTALAIVPAALAATPAIAQAQAGAFPNHAVKVIVGFPVGSSPDVVARIVGDELNKAWGQPVVVENRAGAGAILGSEAAARATPDGHTIYLATLGALALNPHLYKKLPYDPAKDFVGVSFVAANTFALAVHPAVQAQSVAELVALAKANPGKLNHGSGASFSQLLGEAFKSRTGADITHVPYKGVQQAVNGFLGGEVQVIFADLPSILPQHKAGKARIIGVTSKDRSPIAPEIPTIAEQGVAGFDYVTWYAFVAPSATPPEALRQLNRDIVRVLDRADIRQRLSAIGLEAKPSDPEFVTALISSEIGKWGALVKNAGIQPQ